MNTPDDGSRPAGDSLSAEHRLGIGHVPTTTATSSAAPPTPGIALAAARPPGSPALPDWDPASLSLVLARMANDLFGNRATPPVFAGQPGATTQPSAGSLPTQHAMPDAVAGHAPEPGAIASTPIATPPTASASQTHAPAAMNAQGLDARASTPVDVNDPGSSGGNPFARPLEFGDLDAPAFDSIAVHGLRLVDGQPTSEGLDTPYFLAPAAAARPPEQVPAARAPHAFEIEPERDVTLRTNSAGSFDPHAIRREFPILEERIRGRRLVWLDNAATTQKPRDVIERLKVYYERENSNIHRAAHTLAARATDAYESARETTRRFLNAPSTREIVFVRGTTEGINLVAQSWGRRNVREGDEILVTWLEHHANIVPWQQLCSETGARLRVAPVDDRGQILLDEYEKLLSPRTRLVSMTHVSNALGTITPAHEMIEMAHRHGAFVLLDGAQSVSHMPVDVQALDCDFFVFSGHKVFGPTGIGALFAKSPVLESMPPWQGGGNMIQDVTFEKTVFQPPPMRFEAGTGNIADAVGLGAALDWLSRIGIENVGRYEHELLEYGTRRLAEVPGLTMIGTAPDKAGVLSFVLAGQKTEEVGGLLDQEGIAVRSGHHCAQPILRRFGLEATVRASLAPYNTCEDIDALVEALRRLQSGQHGLR